MIDALLYAVRDAVRAAGFGYGVAECEITDDGRPPPRDGNWFVAIHGGRQRSGPANVRNLDGLYDFSVTLTGRITVPLDRVGDQLLARNIERVPLGYRQGFNAKADQLGNFLHSNWRITVLQGQTPASANDNLIAWGSGTGIYGFVEPARWQGPEVPTLVSGAEWFGDDPDSDTFALKSELRFMGARRFQPQTASVGVFV